MKRTLLFVWLGLLAGLAVPVPAAARAPRDDGDAQLLAERQRDFEVELREFAASLQGLEFPAAEAHAAEFVRAVLAPYLDDLAELAGAAAKPGDQAAAWLRLVQAASMMAPLTDTCRVRARAALAALSTRHLDEPRLAEVANHLRFCADEELRAEAPPVLRALATKAQAPGARAEARLSLAAGLAEGATRGDERLAQALPLLDELERDYGTLPSLLGPSYAEAAARLRFELEHLTPGGPLPDFEARDLEGLTFRLSDYRGRVVLLDFWGLWCKGCVAQLPHLARLVAQHAEAPFALIGINTDDPADDLRARFAASGVTWRNALEPAEDSLSTRWNITGFPTLFLVDAQGILRQRWHVPPKPEELAAEVERWIARARVAAPAEAR